MVELFARSREKQPKHCPIKSDYTQTSMWFCDSVKYADACSFQALISHRLMNIIWRYFLPSEEKVKQPFDWQTSQPEQQRNIEIWADSV